MTTLVDRAVEKKILELAHDIIEASKKAPAEPTSPKAVSQEPGLRRALVKAGSRLDSLTAKYVDDVIPRDSYERLRDEIQAEISRLELRLKEVRVSERQQPVKIDPAVLLMWSDLSVKHRRDLLQVIVGSIQFWSGRPAGRVEVLTHWELLQRNAEIDSLVD